MIQEECGFGGSRLRERTLSSETQKSHGQTPGHGQYDQNYYGEGLYTTYAKAVPVIGIFAFSESVLQNVTCIDDSIEKGRNKRQEGKVRGESSGLKINVRMASRGPIA